MVKITDVIKNPEIQDRFASIANRLNDCTRNHRQDFADLEHGLIHFSNYGHITEKKEFSKDEKDVISQEIYSSQLLLATNYREKDSSINKMKNFFFCVNSNIPPLVDFASTGILATNTRERVIIFEKAFERDVFPELREKLAEDAKALNVDFTAVPNALTVQVWNHVSIYFRTQYTEVHGIFLNYFNSPYTKENPFLFRFDGLNTEISVSLAKKASEEAIVLIRKNSLIGFFNANNPGKMTYQERYKHLTGREYTQPYNKHKMAAVPAAFFPTTSKNNIDETAFM